MAAMDDYCPPADSTPAALRRQWRLLARLFSRQDPHDTLAQPEATLSSLPPAQLDRLAPPLHWEGAARAFDQIYASKAGSAPTPGVIGILVGQPFCGHADILAHWARGRSVRLLEPPTAQEILAADVQWLTRCCDSGPGLWALPALERCYLRNANGLALVRGFLDLAFSGALGPGVIGCDSWAWAYLQRICAWPATPVLTLQAFDGAALTTLLLQPQAQPTQAVRFLSAHSGTSLLPEPEDGEEDAAAPVSPELRQLAARCRGNLGVAWHFWRERLRTATEPQKAQTGDDAPPPTDAIWVAPELEPRAPASDAGDETALVLHALLLHNGLEAPLLATLLPIAAAHLNLQLLHLHALGLVERQDADRWQVTPLAYPGVRAFLRARGYLTDSF
jgi:hypothetical protein